MKIKFIYLLYKLSKVVYQLAYSVRNVFIFGAAISQEDRVINSTYVQLFSEVNFNSLINSYLQSANVENPLISHYIVATIDLGKKRALMAVYESLDNKSAIIKPPGSAWLSVLNFFYKAETVQEIFGQAIGDWHQEYISDLNENRYLRAKMTWIRYNINILTLIIVKNPLTSLIEYIKKLVT